MPRCLLSETDRALNSLFIIIVRCISYLVPLADITVDYYLNVISFKDNYCNSLLAGTSGQTLSRLQLVQNTLPRVVAQKPCYCRITPVLIDLHWLPVRQRIDFKIATTSFKVLHYQQLSYLAEILPRYAPSRSLRSFGSTTISAPLRKTSMVSLKSFSSVASSIWNKLPGYLSSVETLPVSRKHLKHHLFLQTYHGFTPPAISAVLTSNIIPST